MTDHTNSIQKTLDVIYMGETKAQLVLKPQIFQFKVEAESHLISLPTG